MQDVVHDRGPFELLSWGNFVADAFVVVAMNDSSPKWKLTKLED